MQRKLVESFTLIDIHIFYSFSEPGETAPSKGIVCYPAKLSVTLQEDLCEDIVQIAQENEDTLDSQSCPE